MMKRPILYAVLAFGMLTSQSGHAIVISAGGAGCDFVDLQEALDFLAPVTGDGHRVRLAAGTMAIPDGLKISQTADLIALEGGYQDCADESPTEGLRTILDAAGGNDGTAIEVQGRTTSRQQQVEFRSVTIRGGSSETFVGANPEGGGLEVRGHVEVLLSAESIVENNESGKGAGVFLSGPRSRWRSELVLRERSSIVGNTARGDGGGVYCQQHGRVVLIDGQVGFNQAYQGGGIYANPGCSLFHPEASAAGRLMIVENNHASLNGGGIYVRADGRYSVPLQLAGDSNNPIHFIANAAAHRGGGLYVQSTRAERQQLHYVMLENTVWIANRAFAGGAIALFGDIGLTLTASRDCHFSFFGRLGCSAFDLNLATGGAGAIAGFGGTRPILIWRTRFEENRGAPAAIGDQEGRLIIESSVFRNNLGYPSQGPGSEALIFEDGVTRLRFSTVLNNQVRTILDTRSGSVDLTGSIVWSPPARIWQHTGGRLFHNACLIAHSAAGLPGGVLVEPPMLEPDFTPGPRSPAIDVCVAPEFRIPDFHGEERGFDQPRVRNLWGPYDLGAVERLEPIGG